MVVKIFFEKMKNVIFDMFKNLRETHGVKNINYEESFYSDLMPRNDVDRIDEYLNALDWAVNIKHQRIDA